MKVKLFLTLFLLILVVNVAYAKDICCPPEERNKELLWLRTQWMNRMNEIIQKELVEPGYQCPYGGGWIQNGYSSLSYASQYLVSLEKWRSLIDPASPYFWLPPWVKERFLRACDAYINHVRGYWDEEEGAFKG